MKFVTIEFIRNCKTLNQKKGAIVQVDERTACGAIRRKSAKIYDLKQAEKEAREKREAKAELKIKVKKEAEKKEKKVINLKKDSND